ncbi:L-seryl-tRNA(Sec) kinase isoform X2 [Sorex araneus]|uniref:L-seryl-tRNA(Sec) kinase isoform X2 n=1 Tax=Sorex araneus TaxID=42254 RepID=UPI00243393C9|nr:L-seryl-tRNA(Sec) kinase isoform X2 [Sorex araneus]
MRTSEEPRGERAEGARKLGLCVLCGLPAAGKSTLARALAHRLRLELGWDVGVVAYDDVMPEAVPEEAGARPLPARWKRLRQELLAYLESLLGAVTSGAPLAAPPQTTEAMWADFVACLKNQDLLPAQAPDAPSRCPLSQAAGSRPLLLILDDNFYYQSMRYEVYQLARKYSSGFCQLFLDCPLETCLARNAQRARPVPAETLRQMAGKLERPDPERNAWERLSLSVPSTEGTSRDSQKLTDLLRAALDDPVKAAEDNLEQKEADRAICAENALHQADQGLRRVVSQTMKEAKGRVPPCSLKLLAQDLNKLKAEFLEDLRQGHQEGLRGGRATHVSEIISLFHCEKRNIVQRYLPKNH